MDSSDYFISSDGMPKICVPVSDKSRDGVLDRVCHIADGAADFIEWRIDCYDNVEDVSDVVKTAGMIKDILDDMPLLVTFRTANEGGQREISFVDYRRLLLDVAKSGAADMVDVEVFFCIGSDVGSEGINEIFLCEGPVLELIAELKKHVTVIGSYHDFNMTPNLQEMVDRLCFAVKCGVDIPKLAVMPKSEEDVLLLLNATLKAKRKLNVPVITMSMGKTGVVSRLLGESFGSSVTFGCVGRESAPGQIDADILHRILSDIHKELS